MKKPSVIKRSVRKRPAAGSLAERTGRSLAAAASRELTLRRVVTDVLESQLSPGQQELIKQLYGLDGAPPKTLRKVAAQAGASPEDLMEVEADVLRSLMRYGLRAN